MIPPFLRPLPRKFTRVRRQGRCFPYPRIGQLVYSTMSLFVCKAILKISPRNPPVAGRARENPYPFASLTYRGFRGWSTQLRWSGRLKIPERPSAEGFYCPARARAPERPLQRDFPGLRCQPPHPRLGCRFGSCAPVGRVQDRRSWQRRPVRGRAPPALAHPPPAPRLWRKLFPFWRGRGILILIFK